MSKKAIIFFTIGVFMVGLFTGVAIACAVYTANAAAEDAITYRCWVVCQPGSEVMIRSKPNKRAEIVGAAGSGERLWTDWEERNGWIHVVDVASETGEGWIFEGYVAFTEPEAVNDEMRISAKGRVACREWIGGKRTRWIRNGETVTVYWIADDVAVTDRGYIMSKYLERR